MCTLLSCAVRKGVQCLFPYTVLFVCFYVSYTYEVTQKEDSKRPACFQVAKLVAVS